MRGMNSLPLGDDIIDRILTFLPNHSTLQATILSSKSFYNVFKNHPNSVLRAVSYNVTGPALPQAVRVLRYSPPEPDAQTDLLMTPPPRPWAESDPVSPITNEECRQLQHNAEVVNALEDLFSSRHKDRTSQTSVLNSMESWRFRTAVYRAMLFAKVFPADDHEEDFDDPEPDDLSKVRLQRKELLSEFYNFELREFSSATLFLEDVAKWAGTADVGYSTFANALLHSGDIALARGPEQILAAYHTRSADELVGALVDNPNIPLMLQEYISHPLTKIWEERKEKPPPDDAKHWHSILDIIHGDQDTCQRCNTICGFDLWNETNWEHLYGISHNLTKSTLPALAKGNLSRSVFDGPRLTTKLNDPNLTYTKLLEQIHQVRTTPYDAWDKQDWLCAACITELIRSHLHLWFLERKREAGEQIPEECWYGYNCRTQMHSMHHAVRVNHLCEPTR